VKQIQTYFENEMFLLQLKYRSCVFSLRYDGTVLISVTCKKNIFLVDAVLQLLPNREGLCSRQAQARGQQPGRLRVRQQRRQKLRQLQRRLRWRRRAGQDGGGVDQAEAASQRAAHLVPEDRGYRELAAGL